MGSALCPPHSFWAQHQFRGRQEGCGSHPACKGRRCCRAWGCSGFFLQAAERDWEEKRAALTQYSAKDINRLLEETQAELMKAIPDLEFAAKHKQAAGSGSTASTPEHKPSKPQHAPKSGGKGDPNGRRGSGTVWGGHGSTSIAQGWGVAAVPSPVGLPGLSRAALKGRFVPWVLDERGRDRSRALTAPFVPRRADGAAVPDRETFQITTASPSTPELPLVPRADHNPQRRSHRHQQERARVYKGSERGAMGRCLGCIEWVTIGDTPLTAPLPACRRPNRRSWRRRSRR